jgi:membrane protease YdiL (CAAX protease family)
LERIDLLALWFLLLFGGFVPYVTIKSSRAVRAGAPIPPRTTIYRNVLIMQAVFLAAALAGAGAGRIDVLAAGDIRQRRRLLISRPHGYGEFRWWIPVALAAGTVEEIVYRGVLPTLLMHPITRWLGSGAADGTVALGGPINSAWCLAAGISTVAFVLGHFGQGVPRAVFLAVFSVVCHLLVRTSGSLFLAMAFHVVYDVFAGISSIRAARELEPATGG